MTAIIVDASRIGNVILPDERSDITERLLQIILEADIFEPAHWPVEIGNLVLRAWRRKRLSLAERNEAHTTLKLLIGGADIETVSYAMDAFGLAVRHQITVHDASYLEMALRRGMPLLTDDSGLRTAALASDVELIEL